MLTTIRANKKLHFVQDAASVNLGSHRTLAAMLTDDGSAGQSELSLRLSKGQLSHWKREGHRIKPTPAKAISLTLERMAPNWSKQ